LNPPILRILGSFAEGASGYGVLDMAGNAREWVDGTFEAYPGSKASNPQFGQGLKVVRGGDFRAGCPLPNDEQTWS